MKQTDQVWYTMSRTLNVGNYESVKFEIGESRSVDGRVPDEVFAELRKEVNQRMSVIVKKLKGDDKSE